MVSALCLLTAVTDRQLFNQINQTNNFSSGLSSGTTAKSCPPETVSWCPASSQEKTSWTGVSWGGDKI